MYRVKSQLGVLAHWLQQSKALLMSGNCASLWAFPETPVPWTPRRGEAAGRQVPDARLGLVETMGGGVAGIDGNACVVAVLERNGQRVGA